MEIFLYSLGAVLGVFVLSGAIWTVAAAYGASQALQALTELRTRLQELETAFQFFADQFELQYTRNAAKIGKLRAQLARERGEDEDEPQDVVAVSAAQNPTFGSGDDVLKFARARGMVR